MIDHSTTGTQPGVGPASGPVDAPLAYCSDCGAATSACPGCGRELDPPRFCTRCGRRLSVVVSPGGYRARCRDHGPVPAVAQA